MSIVVTWVWTGLALRRAFGDVQGGRARDDAVARRRMGALRDPASTPSRRGSFRPKARTSASRPGATSRRDDAAVNPMRRAGQMHELQNLAAFLMADGCELPHRPDHRRRRRRLASPTAAHSTSSSRGATPSGHRAREAIKAQTEKGQDLSGRCRLGGAVSAGTTSHSRRKSMRRHFSLWGPLVLLVGGLRDDRRRRRAPRDCRSPCPGEIHRAGDRRPGSADLRSRGRARGQGVARRPGLRTGGAVRARRGHAGRSHVRRSLQGLQLDGLPRQRRVRRVLDGHDGLRPVDAPRADERPVQFLEGAAGAVRSAA